MTPAAATSRPNPWLIVAAATLVHVAVSLLVERPLILPDEAGYLLNARRIATMGDPSQLVYFPGYSVLIAPIFAISSDLATVFRWAQAVNAILAGVTALLTWHVARRLFPAASTAELVTTLAVVTLYPSYLLFSSLAVSENLFVPATLLGLLLLLRLAEHPTTVRAVALGAVSGAAVLIHQRAITLAFGAVVGFIAVSGPRHRTAVIGILTTAGCVVGGLVFATIVLDPSSESYQFGVSARTSVSGLVTDNLGPRALFTLPFTILGQLFYISVATFGLAPLASVWLVRWTRMRLSGDRSPQATGALWLVTVVASSVLIAGLFMNQGTGDKAIYGRYLEAVLAPLLAIGTLELLERRHSASMKLLVGVPAGMAATLIAVRGTDAFLGRQQLLNIATIEPIVRYVGIDLFWIAVVGVVGTAALLLAVRRAGAVGLSLLVVAYAVSTAFVFVRATDALDNLAGEQRLGGVLADELLPLVPADRRCVAIDDLEPSSPWYQQNYRLEQFDLEFERWEGTTGDEPCGAFVLSSNPQIAEIIPGALMVAAESERNFAVWFVGGADDLAGAELTGTASPTAFLEQLSLIQLSDPRVVSVGDDEILVQVTLTNTTDEILVPAPALPDAYGGVSVGAEWKVPGDEERLHEPRRAWLPGMIRPGERVVVETELPFEIDDWEWTPGPWIVHFEMVQEGWRWSGPATGVDIEVDLP